MTQVETKGAMSQNEKSEHCVLSKKSGMGELDCLPVKVQKLLLFINRLALRGLFRCINL